MNHTKPPEPSPAQTAQWWDEARDVHADNPGLAPMQLARLAYAAGWEARCAEDSSVVGAPPAAASPPVEGDVGELVAWLTEQAVRAADCKQPMAAGMLTWAAEVAGEHADLLEQRQAAPVPVAVSDRLPQLLQERYRSAADEYPDPDGLAAVLETLADQDETLFDENEELMPAVRAVRTDRILAIAAELRGGANG